MIETAKQNTGRREIRLALGEIDSLTQGSASRLRDELSVGAMSALVIGVGLGIRRLGRHLADNEQDKSQGIKRRALSLTLGAAGNAVTALGGVWLAYSGAAMVSDAVRCVDAATAMPGENIDL